MQDGGVTMPVLGRGGILEVAEPMADRSIPADANFLCLSCASDIEARIGSEDITLEPQFCDKHVWKRGIIIRRNWVMSVSGYADYTVPAYELLARKAMLVWFGATFFVRWYPFGKGIDGAAFYQGNANIKGKEVGGATRGAVDFSLSITGDGYLNRGAVEVKALDAVVLDYRTHGAMYKDFRHHQ